METVAEKMEYDEKGKEIFANNEPFRFPGFDLPSNIVISYKGQYKPDINEWINIHAGNRYKVVAKTFDGQETHYMYLEAK